MIIRMVERSYRMRERAGVKGEAYEREEGRGEEL